MGPMLVRSRSTTVPKWVTPVCMEAMPTSATRRSHVPGRSARDRDREMKRKREKVYGKVKLIILEG